MFQVAIIHNVVYVQYFDRNCPQTEFGKYLYIIYTQNLNLIRSVVTEIFARSRILPTNELNCGVRDPNLPWKFQVSMFLSSKVKDSSLVGGILPLETISGLNFENYRHCDEIQRDRFGERQLLNDDG